MNDTVLFVGKTILGATDITISIGDYSESFQMGDDLVCSDLVMLTHISTTVICKNPTRGRYLTIQACDGIMEYPKHQHPDRYLYLCEIELFGTGKYIL